MKQLKENKEQNEKFIFMLLKWRYYFRKDVRANRDKPISVLLEEKTFRERILFTLLNLRYLFNRKRSVIIEEEPVIVPVSPSAKFSFGFITNLIAALKFTKELVANKLSKVGVRISSFAFQSFEHICDLGKTSLRRASQSFSKSLQFLKPKQRIPTERPEIIAAIIEVPKKKINRFREDVIFGILKIRYIYILSAWSFRQKAVTFLTASVLFSIVHFSQTELQAGSPVFYMVKQGDCLFNIAKDYKANVNDLIIWNNIKNVFTVHVGAKLLVGYKTDSTKNAENLGIIATYHKIKPKETLYALSQKYNTTVDYIVRWNDIKDISKVDTGMNLIVGIKYNAIAEEKKANPIVSKTSKSANESARVLHLVEQAKTEEPKAETTVNPDSSALAIIPETTFMDNIAETSMVKQMPETSVVNQTLKPLVTTIKPSNSSKPTKAKSKPQSRSIAKVTPAPPIQKNISSVSSPIYHTMKWAETLYSIARKYNTNVDKITAWNHLNDVSKIDTGTKLIVGYNSTHAENIAVSKPVPVHSVTAPTSTVTNYIPPTESYTKPVAENKIVVIEKPVQKQVSSSNFLKGPTEEEIVSKKAVEEMNKRIPVTAYDSTHIWDTTNVTAKDSAVLDSAALAQAKLDSVAKEKARLNALPKHVNKWYDPKVYVKKVQGLPFVIAALILIALMFAFTALTFFIVIIISRIKSTVNEAIKANFDIAFEELITHVIFHDGDADSKFAEDQFNDEQQAIIEAFDKKYLNNPYHRQLCIDSILNIYKNLTGVIATRVVNLYHEFNLTSDTIGKLKHRKWYLKAKGIQEVEQMNVVEAYKAIYKFIDHPNDTLRYEAQIAIMSLKEEKNLIFLEDVKLPLTEWQQMMIANKLHTIRKRDLSNIDDLLLSTNPTVVSLAIKIIQDFNMIEFSEKLKELLHKDDLGIKIASAKALSDLITKAAIPDLLIELKSAPNIVKEVILASLAKIGIEDHLHEISIYVLHDNFEVAYAASNALISSGEAGLAELRDVIRLNEEHVGLQMFSNIN